MASAAQAAQSSAPPGAGAHIFNNPFTIYSMEAAAFGEPIRWQKRSTLYVILGVRTEIACQHLKTGLRLWNERDHDVLPSHKVAEKSVDPYDSRMPSFPVQAH
jgi:hypothetical protein